MRYGFKNWMPVFLGICTISSLLLTFQNCGRSSLGKGASVPPGRALSQPVPIPEGYITLSGVDSQNRPIREITKLQVLSGNYVVEGDILVGKVASLEGATHLRWDGHSNLVKDTSGVRASGLGFELSAPGDAAYKRRWPDGKLPIHIPEGLWSGARERIGTAIAELNATFSAQGIDMEVVEVDFDTQAFPIFLQVTDGNGCASYLGRGTSRIQEIYMSRDCAVGNIKHEFLHALGVGHEHSRSDRNRYIEVFEDNVLPDFIGNFHIFETRYPSGEVKDYGEYDFGSIMHYGRSFFSIDRSLPTIQVLPPYEDQANVIGQRRGLSAGDIETLKEMYPPKKVRNPFSELEVFERNPASLGFRWTPFLDEPETTYSAILYDSQDQTFVAIQNGIGIESQVIFSNLQQNNEYQLVIQALDDSGAFAEETLFASTLEIPGTINSFCEEADYFKNKTCSEIQNDYRICFGPPNYFDNEGRFDWVQDEKGENGYVCFDATSAIGNPLPETKPPPTEENEGCETFLEDNKGLPCGDIQGGYVKCFRGARIVDNEGRWDWINDLNGKNGMTCVDAGVE